MSSMGIEAGEGRLRASIWLDGRVELVTDARSDPPTMRCSECSADGDLGSWVAGERGDLAAPGFTGACGNGPNAPTSGQSLSGASAPKGGLRRDPHELGCCAVGDILFASVSKLKRLAETRLACEVRSAVVVVPARFDDEQVRAITCALERIRVQVTRILRRPTAVAFAHRLEAVYETGALTLLVVDLGTNALEVALLKLEDGAFQTVVTTSESHLGGKNFGHALVQHCVRELEATRENFDAEIDPHVMRQLSAGCARALRTFLSCDAAAIGIEVSCCGSPVCVTIGRALFNRLCAPLFGACLALMLRALADASVRPKQVQIVLLAGRFVHMARLQQLVRELFDAARIPTTFDDPDTIVRHAAAVQAAFFAGLEPFGDKLEKHCIEECD